MICGSDVSYAPRLLRALTAFINLVLDGKTTPAACPFFFGTSLIALQKTDGGGVRHIAVGCTLQRLAAKCAGARVMEVMGDLLAPFQLGYGTLLGAEAAVHSARTYLHNLQPGHLILKLDFKNAFNTIRHDKMLLTVKERVPDSYPLVHSAYSVHSSSFFGGDTLKSAEDIQQGVTSCSVSQSMTLFRNCSQSSGCFI